MFQGLENVTRITIPENVLSQDLVEQGIEDEIIFLNLQGGGYFGANATGKFIWECITETMPEGISPSAILEKLQQEFDVDEERFREDLLHFLQELHANGLIHLG